MQSNYHLVPEILLRDHFNVPKLRFIVKDNNISTFASEADVWVVENNINIGFADTDYISTNTFTVFFSEKEDMTAFLLIFGQQIIVDNKAKA